MTDIATLGIAIDSQPVDTAVRSLADLQRQGQSTEQSVNKLSESGKGLRTISSGADTASRSMGSLATAATAAFAALSVSRIVDMADEWGQYASRMKMATQSMVEYDHAQERMAQSAQKTFRSINETRESFIQLSPILREMGLTLDQSIDAVDAFSGLLVVSGANAQRSATAMEALAKSFQKGKVDAMAWMTIYSTADSIVDHLATSSGLAASEIRRLGAEGKLTADMFATALTSGAAKITKQVEGMPTTVRDAFTNLNTVFGEFIGKTNEVSQATAGMVKVINVFADNLDLVVYAAGALATLKIGAVIGSWGAQALVASRSVALLAKEQWQLVAASNAAAGAGTAAKLAFTAIGGPIGALSLAASTGYIIWNTYAEKTKLAKEALDSLGTTADEVRDSIDKLNASQRTMAKSEAAKQVDEAAEEMERAMRRMLGPIRDLRNQDEANAVSWLRGELKRLAEDSSLSARQVNEQMQSIVNSLVDAGSVTKSHASGFTKLILAYTEWRTTLETARVRLDALTDSENAASKAVENLTEKAAIARAAQQALSESLSPEKWGEYIGKLELAAAAIGMNAQQFGELEARAAGANDEQARLAGVLAGAANAAKVLEKATADKDQKGIDGAKAVLEQLAAQEAQLRSNIAYATVYNTLLASGADYITAAVEANNAADEAYVSAQESIAKRLKELYQNIKVNTAPSKETNKASAAIEKHTNAINDQVKALQFQAATVGMAEDRITLYKLAIDGATKSQLESAKAAIDDRKARELLAATAKKQVDASAAAVRSLRDEVDKNRDLARTFGMTASAIEDMTAARLEEALVVAQQKPDNDHEIEALEKMIELRRENAGLLRDGEARDADIARWNDWQQEVDQIFQQVGQSLTDAIFEGGKSGRDLVKSLFKTLTFKVLIQPVMNAMQGQVTQQLGGMFGGQNPAQSAGGLNMPMGGGGLGFGGTISNLGKQFGSAAIDSFGAGMSGVFSGADIFAGEVASAAGLDGIGAMIASNSSSTAVSAGAAVSQALPYLGAIFAATQGQYGTAIGTAAGAFIGGKIGSVGGPLGAAVGAAVGMLADGLFNSEPKTRHGKTTQYELTAADEIKLTHNEADGLTQDYYEAIAGMTRSAVDGINSVYAQLGIDANVSGFWARTDASKTGKGDGVSSGGGMIVDGEYRQVGVPPSSDSTQFGFGGWSDAPMLPRLAVDLQMTMLEAFQAAAGLMPKVLGDMFEGVNIRGLGAEQVQALAESFNGVIAGAQALQAAAEALPFENLKNLSFDAAAGLMALAGGLDNLIGLQSSFIDNFYTDAEKQALQIQNISAALASVGVEMPEIIGSTDEMKAAYRALVDAQDVSTESGQRAYVALLATGGAFVALAESAGLATNALATRAEIDQALQDGLKSALDSVVSIGQAEIERLRESSNVTDQAMAAFRTAAQNVQNEWRGLITAIDQGIKTLRAGADDAFNQDYTLARARISTALVTGQVNDKSGMADAVKIAQQGVTGGVYASQFAQEKAYLTLANELEGLKDIAQPELDTAAATLAQLEEQYALLRGTKKVLDGSLEQLELQLRAAFTAEETANIQIAQIQSQIDIAKMQYDELLGIKAGILSFSQALSEFAATAAAIATSKGEPNGGGYAPSDQAYYAEKAAQLRASGDPQWANATISDVEQAFGDAGFTPDDHWRLHGKDEGLKRPGYAVGTPFVPYDMAANIHRGEIIIDPRSSDILRRYGIGVQGGGNAEVVTELRALREQNAQLEKRLAGIERTNAQLADQFDMVSAGGNALATEVMA